MVDSLCEARMKLDKYEITKVLDDCNLENSKLWHAEVEFGFFHLKEPISLLAANSEILEF